MFTVRQALLDHFAEQGFVVVEGVFDPTADLQPVVDEYSGILDGLAQELYARKKISSLYSELPFGRRMTQIVAETGQAYSQHFDISLPQAGVTEETPVHNGPAIFNLLTHQNLLDVIEAFIGPEIYSNPVQHVRIKPPERLLPKGTLDGLAAAVYWHQDNGVILPEADESEILTVWLPITDSTEENGCLCVVPGSHKDGLQTHCANAIKGVHIPDRLITGEPLPVPMQRGSVLIMHRKTMHSSLRNLSDDIRWSLDLRYNPIGQPTGRPALTGFIARSRANPEAALCNAQEWAKLWDETRRRLARSEKPVYNRWDSNIAACA